MPENFAVRGDEAYRDKCISIVKGLNYWTDTFKLQKQTGCLKKWGKSNIIGIRSMATQLPPDDIYEILVKTQSHCYSYSLCAKESC